MKFNLSIIVIALTIVINFNCSTKKFSLPTADSDNGGLILPEGFAALVVADSVGLTRHLAIRDNGDIYIKLRYTTGNQGNMALRDTNNDGKADIFKRWGDYPNDGSFATEMRIHKDYLYFSSEQIIYRQKLEPTKLIPETPIEIIVIDHHPIQWHNAKCLAFDNEDNIYITFGSPTNACEDPTTIKNNSTIGIKGFNPCPQLADQAGIWKFKINKTEQYMSDGEHYATGIRSSVGIVWNQQTNSLFAISHGRDYLYEHAPEYYTPKQNAQLPAEELLEVKQSDNFGWPYTYYDHYTKKRMMAPEYNGNGKIFSTIYKNPAMAFPAHWAPNDLLFYTGDMFPARYKDGAFIAFHGSTNRNPYPQQGYVVAFVPFEKGKPLGTYEIFADGFAGVDTIHIMPEAHYRPMGLAQGPDGSLYISESKKGKIWRITYTLNPKNFNKTQLSNMEKLSKTKSYLVQPDN
ncbi:MAG: PQQ-dependent sugar dehydrogenase [Sediminibacterium sp.]|nr:PQQ-dependent sugar dehydrogenase [Sediminibacterium sp.]